MPVITPGMIAGVASMAGFSGTTPTSPLVVAVAVAMAESGGRTDAMGDTTIQTGTWGPSVGLWQIRSLKAERGKNTARDADALTNPVFNARAAFKISREGADWSPWSAYTNKRYLMFIPVATAAAISPARVSGEIVGSAPGTAVVEGIGDTATTIGAGMDAATAGMGVLADRASQAGAWLGDRQNWVRVLQVVAGVVLVGAGLTVAARPLAGTAVSTVLPVGKIGKAIGKAAK